MSKRCVRILSLTAGLFVILVITFSAGQDRLVVAQTVQATAAATMTSTADLFAGLSIDELTSRSYGGGQITIVQKQAGAAAFTRYIMKYPSDGLTIYGFMDVPTAPPKNGVGYPVVIAVHGHIALGLYQTLDYTTRYADALAAAGYLVLHPNLRNHFPSDNGPDPLHVGYAIDVLNLVAIARAEGGQPGSLQQADPNRIGLWGHSMGGGISIRVMTVDPKIRAVVLYGAVSGDEKQNIEDFHRQGSERHRPDEINIPDDVYQRVSPMYFYGRIQAAISIHHGAADTTVPPIWSTQLCAQLQALQKTVECFSYPGENHTFHGAGDRLLIQRMIAFYDSHLAAAP